MASKKISKKSAARLWKNVLRPLLFKKLTFNVASILFGCILAIALLLLLDKFNFIPRSGGNIAVSPMPGIGFSIAYDSPQGRQKTTVLSVPAYRMVTRTGIYVHPNETVNIYASGSIATDSGFDWFPNSPCTNVDEKLNRFRFNHNANPSWRAPNGRRLYHLTDADFSGNSENSKDQTDLEKSQNPDYIHNGYKLFEDEDYGCLLGCIIKVKKSDDITLMNEIRAAHLQKRIFKIGCQRSIHIQNENNNNILFSDWGDKSNLTVYSGEGQLVLLVNDIMLDEKLLTKLITCYNKKGEKSCIPYYAQTQLLFHPENKLKQRISRKIKFNLFASEMWYWDNIGSFSVTITTTQK